MAIDCSEFSKKYLYPLRYQLIYLTIIGFIISESINVTYVEKFKNDADETYSKIPPLAGMARDRADKIAQYILGVFDTFLFGFGVSFLIAAGMRVFEIKNKLLKRRMIGSWIAISFFCISWWPHSTAHNLILLSSRDPTDNYIIMEICFHWTLMLCACFLSYFQYDLIKLMHEVAMTRKKMATGNEQSPLYGSFFKNIHVHALAITVVLFTICMALLFKLDPVKTSLKTYQQFFYITFKVVDSALSSLGFAFAYIMIRIILQLPANKGRTVAIVSTFCIWFNFMIQVPHPLIHIKSPLTFDALIVIDYCVHIPIMVTTGILAFYQFRMLELATDKKSSLSIATSMRKGSRSIAMEGKTQSGSDSVSSSHAYANSAVSNIEMSEIDTINKSKQYDIESGINDSSETPSIEEIVVNQS